MSSVGATAGPTPLAGSRRAIAVATVLAAMAVAVLDAGMVNIGLPSLAAAFAVPPARAILVVTAYQAALLMALLPLGALGERYGHRRVFTISVAVFTTASAAASLAPDLPCLIVARFLQGLGGAGIMALGMALLRFSLPAGELGRAVSWNALNVALMSAAAPALGALLLVLGDWRALFAASLPIAGLALLGSRALPSTRRSEAVTDVASMGLSALMFALLIAAAQTAARSPGPAAIALTMALVALVLLMRREAPKAEPLFPLDLLRGKTFRLSAIASVCCFAAQTAGLVALSFLLQHQLRLPPLATGLFMMAWPVSVAIAAALAARLSDRAPAAWLCAIGASALSAGLAGCALPTGPMGIIPAVLAAGMGFGLFQTPNNRNLFLASSPLRSGAVGALQGTARVCGQTAGALMVAMLIGQFGVSAALPIGFAAAAVMAAAAGFVSLLRVRT